VDAKAEYGEAYVQPDTVTAFALFADAEWRRVARQHDVTDLK